MRETVAKLFLCRLSSLGFCCKCKVSAKSLELLILSFFEVYSGVILVSVVFYVNS